MWSPFIFQNWIQVTPWLSIHFSSIWKHLCWSFRSSHESKHFGSSVYLSEKKNLRPVSLVAAITPGKATKDSYLSIFADVQSAQKSAIENIGPSAARTPVPKFQRLQE